MIKNKTATPMRKMLSLKEIANEVSPEIEEKVFINGYLGREFLFGKIKITALKNLSFVVNYELYFKDNADKYEMVAKDCAPRNSLIWLSNAAWQELKDAHEKVFNVGVATAA